MPHYQRSSFFAIFIACIALYSYASAFYMQGGLLPGHIDYVNKLNDGTDFIPHPGIFWIAGLISWLFSTPLTKTLFVLLSLHFAITLAAIALAVRVLYDRPVAPLALLLLPLAILAAAPVALPYVNERVYNFTSYNRVSILLRNATHTAMLPYMFLCFAGLVKILFTEQVTKARAALVSLLLFISAVIKPSFAISIIPTITLYALVSKSMDWNRRSRIAYMLFPTALLVIAQVYVGLGNGILRPAMELQIAPLATWTHNNRTPLLSLALAIAFPVLMALFRHSFFSAFTNIAWLNLLIATIPYFTFNMGERDLEWSYLHARQILFLCSAVEWWKWCNAKGPKPLYEKIALISCGLLLSLHALFGYIRLFTIDSAFMRF